MALAERDLDRSPTPSTSLLPVGGAQRKLNGQCACAWSGSDDDIAETSFIAKRGNGDAPDGGLGATGWSFDRVRVPTTSRLSDDMEMKPCAGATAATNRLDPCYKDTKGANDNCRHTSLGACHSNQHGTCCETGLHSPTSLSAAECRPVHARVANNCRLPPEVEQLRRDCVISTTHSPGVRPTADKCM